MNTDPSDRMRIVRETIAAQNAKLPQVDANGVPVASTPAPTTPATDEAPVRRLPGPNPALGSSASGQTNTLQDELRNAELRHDFLAVARLTSVLDAQRLVGDQRHGGPGAA